MAYNRRDLIGHWVKKTQPAQRMCSHACCRNKRVHPKNYPVVLPSALLRKASDEDLAQHYNDVSSRETPQAARARSQILHEMERRDREDAIRKAREKGRDERAIARRFAHAEEVDRVYLEAEAATKGNLLNQRGREARIDDHWLMTAPERDVRRYGSEELLNYFQDNPRPTTAHMRGKDTRLGTIYTAPKRLRHPYYRPRRKAA